MVVSNATIDDNEVIQLKLTGEQFKQLHIFLNLLAPNEGDIVTKSQAKYLNQLQQIFSDKALAIEKRRNYFINKNK